jgi:serine/threonine-protein kinase
MPHRSDDEPTARDASRPRGPDAPASDGGDTEIDHDRLHGFEEPATSLQVPRAKRSRDELSEPTRSERSLSGARRVSGSPRTPASVDLQTSLSTGTLNDAMHSQDAERTRSFAALATGVCVAVSLPLLVLGGDLLARTLFLLGMAMTGCACLWLWIRLRDPLAYRINDVLAVGYVAILGAFSGIHYYGLFSPGPVVIPFGLYFFGLASSFRGTLGVFVSCAVGYAVLAVPIGLGWIEDRGLLRPQGLTTLEVVLVVITVEVIFLATFAIARLSRRATENALAAHDRAVRVIAGRDALLHEARMDLEGVLRERGLGRFTGELVGSYQVGEILGRGGMGEVYEARHADSEEPVALKLLHPHVLGDRDALARFRRECHLAAKLKVAHVVKVIEISDDSAPIPFIAMERLHGSDLAEQLRVEMRMSSRDVLRLLREVGRGLDAARVEGIVHRDIKPRNLFHSLAPGAKQGTWKILDFGVSKLVGEQTLTLDHVVGTPSYMAPEQAEGGEVTHRTDLFALGVIAYRALTGRPAFSGDNAAAILYQVVNEMPPRPSEAHARLDGDVDLVLGIALAKDPWDRFDSAAELADALDKAFRSKLPEALRERAQRVLEKHPWA